MCSDTEIENVIFSIDCDALDVCTKVYEVPSSDLELDYSTTCTADNDQFTIVFASTDITGGCAVDYIEIGGSTLKGTLTKTLDAGVYEAVIYWECGCDPTIITIEEDCCDFVLSPCTRTCGGVVDGCLNDPGVVYTVNGAVLTQTLRDYVEALSPEQSANIVASKGQCLQKTITIPDLESFCCENFAIKVSQAIPTAIII